MSRLIATVFFVGHLRPAPGTWGSAAALALALALHAVGSFPLLAAAPAVLIPVGIWAIWPETRQTGEHDPSEIVIDELAGQWLALWPISFGMWKLGSETWTLPWQFVLASFVLFRLFDIWKPGPIGWADRRHDALGVMLDDVFAGLLAAALVFFGALWAHRVFDLVEFVLWIF